MAKILSYAVHSYSTDVIRVAFKDAVNN